jgi:hypothetical protein
MKSKIHYFILVCGFLLGMQRNTQAQNHAGVVVNFESREPIERVRISCAELNTVVYSDAEGRFKLPVAVGDSVAIEIMRVGFLTSNMVFAPTDQDAVIIYMVPETISFNDVVITASPKVVYSNDTMNVADFQFIGDSLLLLTYEAEERWKRAEEAKITIYKNCELVLLNRAGQVVQVASLPGQFCSLYKKHPGSTFLIGRTDKYYLAWNDGLMAIHRIKEKDFNDIIQPVLAVRDDDVLYTNYNSEFPAFDYYLYHTVDSTFDPLAHIEDEELMRMFRSEYKYLSPREKLEAYRFELETGMDKEYVAAYMRGFQNTNYYEPLNAPMIPTAEGYCLFDHHHDRMVMYTKEGLPVDSVTIKYHRVKKPLKWQEIVYSDEQQEVFYTTYNRNGYTELHRIDASGKSEKVMDLFCRYAEQLTIRDGYAYYVYRPFESSQNRYLYKERIKQKMATDGLGH